MSPIIIIIIHTSLFIKQHPHLLINFNLLFIIKIETIMIFIFLTKFPLLLLNIFRPLLRSACQKYFSYLAYL